MANEVVGNEAGERVDYWTPDVEIVEDEQALTVTADVPGVAPGNVDVSFDEGQLTLVGRVERGSNGSAKVVRTYRRRFTLSDRTRFDTDHISAVLCNGVLELRLPKAEKAKPRQISVTVN
jgi:HSP20 family protein